MRPTELHPNAENATTEELRVAMEASPTKRGYIRLAVIRSLLMGIPRATVCQQFFRTDRMVRLWIECFNTSGIDALITRPRSGRPRKAKLPALRELLEPVLKNPAQAGQVHWTAVKLHGFLKEKLAIELGYRTTVRWLHELDFHLRVPRLWPERQDEEKRKVFLEQLRSWTADDTVELWFLDETGIEGDPRPRRRWAQPGKPRTVPHLGDHIRQNVVGAVCPKNGALFSLIVESMDTEVFQIYLDELAKAVPKKEGQRQLLIMDNASWHKSAQLHWHHFEPAYLPPYSPDFNPIERLWLRLKADWFWDYIAHSTQELSDRLCLALKSFLNDSLKTASICSIRK
ncbi:MAG: IS630 family transposase [Verrucomicrobiota bacterium]